jgi:acetyltransferase-like isoleucine patch superfamily enzyme
MKNNMSQRVLNFLGVSASDLPAVEKNNSALQYALSAGLRSFLRLLANHCIIPSLRVVLFRLSGIHIGKAVQINLNVNFIDDFRPGLITLEDEVSVAPFVSFVASSHANNSRIYRVYKLGATGPVRIKTGAWLGVGAVILPGLTIGECSIIGANAVVTKDVQDYAVVAGVPAVKIGDVRNGNANDTSREKTKYWVT